MTGQYSSKFAIVRKIKERWKNFYRPKETKEYVTTKYYVTPRIRCWHMKRILVENLIKYK